MNVLLVLIRLVLLPFSLLYGLITEVRNLLFDLKILPVYQSPLPIISVGNLVAGGTGKTPFTVWLAAQLAANYRVAVISRGYRRQSKGLQIVSRNGKILTDARQAGDEPLLMAKKLPAVTVLVAEKRREAVEWIEQHHAAEVIVLDDGFQHRYVQRDVDIVLFKRPEQFYRNFMLPTGTWREFAHRIGRAHYVGFAQDGKLPFVSSNKQFHVEPRTGKLLNSYFEVCGDIKQLEDEHVAAFAGIAEPESFFNLLEKKKIVLKGKFKFEDHHRFTESDLLNMVNFCRKEKLKYLICTEKDLVKIAEILNQSDDEKLKEIEIFAPAYDLRVKEENLIKEIKKTIDKKLK